MPVFSFEAEPKSIFRIFFRFWGEIGLLPGTETRKAGAELTVLRLCNRGAVSPLRPRERADQIWQVHGHNDTALLVEGSWKSLPSVRNSPEPPATGIFSRASPVQMGGARWYKWEAYCGTNWRCTAAFPFLQGLEANRAQRHKWGVYCGANWRCTAVLVRQVVRVGGFPNSAHYGA